MLLCFLGILKGESVGRRVMECVRSEAGQSFGGGKLVAAEETRSGAGGEHDKMLTWHYGRTGIRTARSLVFHPHIEIPLHRKVITAAKGLFPFPSGAFFGVFDQDPKAGQLVPDGVTAGEVAGAPGLFSLRKQGVNLLVAE